MELKWKDGNRSKQICWCLDIKSCPTLLRLIWNHPGRNTGVGCQGLLQGISPTQGSKPYLCISCISGRFFTVETTDMLRKHYITVNTGGCIGWQASRWFNGKECVFNAGDLGSIPGLGRFPEGGHGNPLQCSSLENPHGQRSLADYSPRGHKGSDMTEWLSMGHNQVTSRTRIRYREGYLS